jgi:hypothetical protein
MDIDYGLFGVVNQEWLEVVGQGQVEHGGGVFSLELDVRSAPEGWEPALIPLMCCPQMQLLSPRWEDAGQMADFFWNALPIKVGSVIDDRGDRLAGLLDENGKAVVALRARGFLSLEDGRVKSRTVIKDCITDLGDLGGIKSVRTPFEEEIKPTVPGRAIGISAYEVECENGSILHGTSVYPYSFGGRQSLLEHRTLRVDRVQVNSAEYRLGAAPKIEMSIVGR